LDDLRMYFYHLDDIVAMVRYNFLFDIFPHNPKFGFYKIRCFDLVHTCQFWLPTIAMT